MPRASSASTGSPSAEASFPGLGERLAAAGHSSSPSTCAVTATPGECRRGTPRPTSGTCSTRSGSSGSSASPGSVTASAVASSPAAAAKKPELTQGLVLLDPASEVPAEAALQSAEIERLDWSFATRDGAVNALLSGSQTVLAPSRSSPPTPPPTCARAPTAGFASASARARSSSPGARWSVPLRRSRSVPTLVVRPAVPLFDPAGGKPAIAMLSATC